MEEQLSLKDFHLEDSKQRKIPLKKILIISGAILIFILF
jgi:hypothetical protein